MRWVEEKSKERKKMMKTFTLREMKRKERKNGKRVKKNRGIQTWFAVGFSSQWGWLIKI